SHPTKDGLARPLFEAARAEVCVPLLSGSHLVGLLALGSRVTGEAPEREDLEFLRVLASHAASQLHNAQLLEGMMRAREAEAFRTLSTFLVHDLKNFTSTLNLIAQNALRHRDNPEFLQDAFNSVAGIAQTMNRLCASLRSMAGTLRVDPRPGDLAALIDGALAQLDGEGSLRVQRSLSPLPPVRFDGEGLKTVLMNLLLNAREAAGPEGNIQVSTRGEDGWAILEVRDDGPGIPREFLEHELFLPFHTTKSGGTGIGLFQSKSIVEAHGGRITVESEEGKGTLVRVRLPIEGAAAAAPAPPP
ncbi:MAG: ATP-binding protein, partial [Thermoanaerobaculia bacterium]